MAGTPENDDPRAFINAPADEVIERLVRIIRWLKPDVVVTFEPNGGYGHPDHIAIHKHTVQAFHAAADADAFPDAGEIWQASLLFYTAIPRSFFTEMRTRMIANKLETRDIDEFFEDGELGWPDELVNVILDVSATVDSKMEALKCHRTQFGPGNLFNRLPESDLKELMSREYFSMAWPEPIPNQRWSSLFEAIDKGKPD